MAAAATAVRRLVDSVPRSVVDDIYRCSFQKQTGVTLKYMLGFGAHPTAETLVQSGQFLHRELPVRLAHRVTDLENLPYGLSSKLPVQRVRDWYVESFRDLRNFPPIKDSADERAFTRLIQVIKDRHRDVVPTLAIGVAQLKAELSRKSITHLPDVHHFLDKFYMSRIGIRMLIGQHVALHNKDPPPEFIGLISTRTRPVTVAKDAIDDARARCMATYGEAPEVHIYGDPDFGFPYVPGHLHHIIFELVKNSLRAVQERFQHTSAEPPPIRVIVANGDEDVTVKISDEGGGIPRSGMPKIWTYLYSTAHALPSNVDLETTELPALLAGYGYGLPLSRLYARYFGGDMQIISMEGYGTDAYVHLHLLGNAVEPLP
eukprot:jgi/Mesvir1/21618/Mv04041-RA.1